MYLTGLNKYNNAIPYQTQSFCAKRNEKEPKIENGEDQFTKSKKNHKKTIGISLAACLLLAGGYTFAIRKIESKIFKSMANDVKDGIRIRGDEINSKLKNITNEITHKSKSGNDISLWDINPQNNKKYIVICDGIDDNRMFHQENLFKNWVNKGYGIVKFDYSGVSKSTGTYNQKGCRESLETVIDYLNEKGIKNEDIGLIGHSLGTGVVSDFAKDNKVAFVTLIEPFDNFKNAIKCNINNIEKCPKFVKKIISAVPNWMIPIKNTFNNVKNLKKSQNNLLIITSKNDKVTPPKLAKNIYNKLTNKQNISYEEFETGGHYYTREKIDKIWEYINKSSK